VLGFHGLRCRVFALLAGTKPGSGAVQDDAATRDDAPAEPELPFTLCSAGESSPEPLRPPPSGSVLAIEFAVAIMTSLLQLDF
jgi:hypothetical protein